MKYVNRDSELAQRFWEEGKLADCPLYDFHGHLHEIGGNYLPAGDIEPMLDTLSRVGAKSFAFSSHFSLTGVMPGDVDTLSTCKQYGAPLRGYFVVMPFFADPPKDFETILSNPDVYLGCKFLGDYYGTPLELPAFTPYWEFLNEHKLAALCHTWGSSQFDGPSNIRHIAEKYHDVQILVGHCVHGAWDEAVSLAKDFPNVWLELTAVLDDRGVLEKFVSEVGSERLLFGTDLPWYSTYQGIGCVLDAEVSDEDKHNILHRNGERLLALINR